METGAWNGFQSRAQHAYLPRQADRTPIAMVAIAPATAESTAASPARASWPRSRPACRPGDDLHELLQRFLEPVMRLAGAQAGAVRVLSGSGERLQLGQRSRAVRRMCRRSARWTAIAAFAAPPPTGCVRVGRRPQRLHAAQPAVPHVCGRRRRRMLAVPLQHRGRVLGVYNLFFTGGDEPAPRRAGAAASRWANCSGWRWTTRGSKPRTCAPR